MFKNFFEGWYFKHQNKVETVAIIPGIAADHAFIQIITDDNSYNVEFSKSQYKKKDKIFVGNSVFSFSEIILNINRHGFKANGKIIYKNMIPINGDIMGPFRFLPLECRHGVISIHHDLKGIIQINDKVFNFNNGVGWIEKDSGTSFPKKYVWIQSNDFEEKCSIMASIADIPFLGFNFQGVICVVYYREKEYRIATYNGAKVLKCSGNEIIIENKDLKLEISIPKYNGYNLNAPQKGKMINVIKEDPSCYSRFKFWKSDNLLFDMESMKTSCEFVGY